MRNQGERTLKELYDVTQRIKEPEITPVLEGNYRIQGPVDDLDCEPRRRNSVAFPDDKKVAFISKGFHMKVESGTCNVCSAPCSSCMHNNRTTLAMESKIECESSFNRCVTNEADSCSFICADGIHLYKSRICDDFQRTGSEASNLVSPNSSHDSYSENAESKAPARASVTREASEGVDMPYFVPSREADHDQTLEENRIVIGNCLFPSNSHITSDLCHSASSKQEEELRRLECHGDNISWVTGNKDSNMKVDHHNMDSLRKIANYSSMSTNILPSSKVKRIVQVQATDFSHSSGNEERHSNYKREITCTNANYSFSDKSNTAVVHMTKQNSSLNDQSRLLSSHNGYAAFHNDDCKDSDCSCGSQLHVDGKSSLGTQQAGPTTIKGKKPASHDENCQASYIEHGFSADTLKITDRCLKNKDCLDDEISSDEVRKSMTINKVFDMSSTSMEEVSKIQEPEPQHWQVMEDVNLKSELELTDVKVCDICGDAGREALLVFCSKCSDGAEHTYCMRKMLRKVPEGDWLCEECQMEAEAEGKKVGRPQKVSATAKECKLKADAEVEKVGGPEKASIAAKECKHKEHAHKKGNVSEEVKEHAESKRGNMPEAVFGPSKECKHDDLGSKIVDGSEILPRTLMQTSLTENSQKFASKSNLKLMPKLDMKEIDPKVRKVSKEQKSPIVIANRHAEAQEATPSSTKRPSEVCGKSTEMGSPRKKVALSRESSFKKLDTGEARAANLPSIDACQNGTNSDGFSHLQSMLGSPSSKVQSQLEPPCGFLSRSSSFGNLKSKPKVKQLEYVPVKSKITRGFTLNDARKGAINRLMKKSASFKSLSSGHNTELGSKSQLVHPVQVVDPRYSKQLKERNMVEKKNSSILNRPLTNSSPRAGTNISLPRIDYKPALHDIKLNCTSESTNLRMNKGPDDVNGLGRKETKEQSISLAKIVGSTSLNSKSSNEDQRLCQTPEESTYESPTSTDKLYNSAEKVQHQGVPQITESSHLGNKIKNSSILSSSRQAVSVRNQIFRCQRCNETGHTKQFCPANNLRSSLEPSAEKNCRDGNKKRNRWKDAIESTILNGRSQKNTRQNDELGKLLIVSADASFEVASKDLLSNSSNQPRNIPHFVETSNGQELSRIADVDPPKLTHAKDFGLQVSSLVEALPSSTDVQIIEASCNPKTSDLSVTTFVSEELNIKHLIPDQALILANLYRTSAIPDLEFIWKGKFELLAPGNESAPFDGIQAHMSMSSSAKDLELATKFPCEILLEEVPWFSSWPLYYQGIGPEEHNIALFFFATDVESYESSYGKLLEKMLTNDLALRGIVDDVELLIFPSTKLPLHSQRWNRLFFLWGMFKGRRADSLTSEPNSQKKTFGPDLNIDPLLQDLPYVLSSVISDSHKVVSVENPQDKSSRCDISSKSEALKSSTWEEIWDASLPKVEDRMCSSQCSPVQKSPLQNVAYNRLPLEQNSCSFPVSHSISSTNRLSNPLISRPMSRFQMTINLPFSEAKIDDTYQNTFVNERGRSHVLTPSAEVPTTKEQIRHNGASTSYSSSSDCKKGPGKESRTDDEGRGEEEVFLKNEGIFCEEPHRKQASSCFVEAISQAHDGEHKKMVFSEGCITSCSREETFSVRSSSKAHPLFPSFNEQHRECRVDNRSMDHDGTRRQEERFFFPVKPDNPLHVLSLDDEDGEESNSPNLELALWDRKNRRKGRQWKEPLDEGNVSPSLSLSLALPNPKKEYWARSGLKPEQHLQEMPGVNTSLLLFGGGFTDT